MEEQRLSQHQSACKGVIVVVGGCGHIGLPLSIRLTLAGWSVTAFDVNTTVAESVNTGKMPFKENQGDKLLSEALATGRFKATTDVSILKNVPTVILTNGMDLDEYNNPKLDSLLKVFNKMLKATDSEDTLFIFRSTLYPGTMTLLKEHLAARCPGSKQVGRLAYCPERTAEMYALEEIVSLPQIISACDEEAFKKTYDVFRTLAPTLVRVTTEEAEFAKLMTNAWRYLEFAISNQFYTLLQNSGVDFFRVMNAATYGYPRARDFKKPGFCAGPCLVKDTRMLITHTQEGFPLGSAALSVNETLAEAVVKTLGTALRSSHGNNNNNNNNAATGNYLQGRIVGLLGMAFKGNVDDFRLSLSFRVKKVCRMKGAVVLCHDPAMDGTSGLKDGVSIETLLERADGIILCTPHDCYRELDSLLLGLNKPVVDVWNFFPSLGLTRMPELLPGTSSHSPQQPQQQQQQQLAKQEEEDNDGKLTVLVTGSAGFIGGYLVQELLQHGYRVIGVDNFTKYGKVEREYDSNPDYELHQGDAKDVELLKRLAVRCHYVVACAAMIGGISYFHALAYDLLAENERIIAATFDAAIHAFTTGGKLKKIVVLSSSMVFEQATKFPTPEGEQEKCGPPMSTYGFQKLACEYYAKGAWEQYKLPYTIVRPFNCVGVGERRALRRKPEGADSDQLEKEEEVSSGNIKLAMSHVVPDLIQKILKGQDPLHLLGDGKQIRHYTYGGDLARGIRMCMENPVALNNDFNISTSTSTTVLELAEMIWKHIHGESKPFRWVSDSPFRYDVQMRVPDCNKAKELLGFEATTSLATILDELIPWIQLQISLGNM